jgi:hypothetical protein
MEGGKVPERIRQPSYCNYTLATYRCHPLLLIFGKITGWTVTRRLKRAADWRHSLILPILADLSVCGFVDKMARRGALK